MFIKTFQLLSSAEEQRTVGKMKLSDSDIDGFCVIIVCMISMTDFWRNRFPRSGTRCQQSLKRDSCCALQDVHTLTFTEESLSN